MKKRYKVLLLKRIGQISKYDNNYGRKDEPEWFVFFFVEILIIFGKKED